MAPWKPPRPKVNDFITRTERAKQEQAAAEANAAAAKIQSIYRGNQGRQRHKQFSEKKAAGEWEPPKGGLTVPTADEAKVMLN